MHRRMPRARGQAASVVAMEPTSRLSHEVLLDLFALLDGASFAHADVRGLLQGLKGRVALHLFLLRVPLLLLLLLRLQLGINSPSALALLVVPLLFLLDEVHISPYLRLLERFHNLLVLGDIPHECS